MSDATVFEIPDGTMAMTTDAGVVATLLQRDPESGASIRHDGEWVPVTDPATLDGLNFVGVEDDAVALYDEHEADGNLVPIQYYTASADGPYWPDPVVVSDVDLDSDEESDEPAPTDEADEDVEPLAASVTLNSANDLDAAIAAAVMNQDLRWYVERRVAALGLEADLPWQRN
jgi:hypothetical protein